MGEGVLELKSVLLAMDVSVANANAWPRVFDILAASPAIGEVFLIRFGPEVNHIPIGVTESEKFGFFPETASVTTRETLEHYNKFRDSLGYPAFRFLAIKLLSRLDLTGTFRFVDREVVLQEAILAGIDILLRREPDVVVFPVVPHEFFPFVLEGVAKYLHLDQVSFQPSSMAPTQYVRFNRGGEVQPLIISNLDQSIADFIASTTEDSFGRLAQELPPPYMVVQTDKDALALRPKSHIRAGVFTLKWLWRERFPESRDFTGHRSPGGLFARMAKILLTRSLQAQMRKSALEVGADSTWRRPYAVFALHYEPERTSIPDGLPIDYAGDAIAKVRELLPVDVTLVVKEHYSQQASALRGFLGRSPLFYGVIKRFPNTIFSPTKGSLISLVAGAEAVFTLTGTIAIEAVLKGIPVGYFGSPWWDGLPGSIRLGDDTDFSDLLAADIPTSNAVLDFLRTRHLLEMLPGIGSESQKKVIERFGELPPNFNEAEAQSIVNLLLGSCGPGPRTL